MNEQNPFSDIQNTALSLLARREHSRLELRQKLTKRYESSVQVIDQVLAKLQEDGYLSDERFAEAYLRSRMAKGFGEQRVEQELKLRGINDDLIAQSFENLSQQGALFDDGAMRVWRKKFDVLPSDFAQKVKQARFLRYRGFSQDQIERVFRALGVDD